ncbi:LANO_0C07690g1_1 [Lachancea nothofagi CBS 11611]|uniref:Defective in cullin neddylation protein n=1 Tax=Lachancea nothofagi CBS 11611 TaxID=1266666 RepID=A0A1G4J8R1_9SACH|nr:LANO_0C07690g1_1 [Lachancea nothofagi CBS 11611]
MRNNDVDEFIALTKSTRQLAREFLANNNGALEYALNDFYDTCHGGFVTEIRPPAPKLNKLFDRYRSEKADSICTDGLVRFVCDLGLQLEDPVTLCMVHIMKCTGLHDSISRDQFVHNWHDQMCNDLADIKDKLQEQESKLRTDSEYFETIYNYTYGLILESDHKQLTVEVAAEYWKLFFDDSKGYRYAVQPSNQLIELWSAYLLDQDVLRISRDAWRMFFKFVRKYPTIQAVKDNYNELDAWPLLIDEFYEHLDDLGLL